MNRNWPCGSAARPPQRALQLARWRSFKQCSGPSPSPGPGPQPRAGLCSLPLAVNAMMMGRAVARRPLRVRLGVSGRGSVRPGARLPVTRMNAVTRAARPDTAGGSDNCGQPAGGAVVCTRHRRRRSPGPGPGPVTRTVTVGHRDRDRDGGLPGVGSHAESPGGRPGGGRSGVAGPGRHSEPGGGIIRLAVPGSARLPPNRR